MSFHTSAIWSHIGGVHKDVMSFVRASLHQVWRIASTVAGALSACRIRPITGVGMHWLYTALGLLQ